MTSLSALREGAAHIIEQEEGSVRILWRARHLDPAALFAADALISALFELQAGKESGEGSDELAEAERLARSAEMTQIDRQREELRAQQEIARSIVREISTDDGESWRHVVWVDSEESEFDEPGGPIGLQIGWISRGALTALIVQSGLRMKEDHGGRFRRVRSEE